MEQCEWNSKLSMVGIIISLLFIVISVVKGDLERAILFSIAFTLFGINKRYWDLVELIKYYGGKK